MKVTPVTPSNPQAPTQVEAPLASDRASKARAIAAFNQAQTAPVQNPSQVSPEEMTAISSQNPIEDETQELVTEDTEVLDESAKAPETEETKQDPALSRQFAQLARQERALRAKVQQQEQAWKAKEAALTAREAEIASKSSQYESGWVKQDRIKQDALTVLAEAGVSYDELTQQIINQQPRDPRVDATINELKAQIQELKAANETSQKSSQDQQQQAYQAAVRQIETEARNLVKSDPNFESIKATNSVKDVVELITETYNKDGILLTVEEAAQQVEDYLTEEAYKLASLSKIQKRMQANASKQPTNATAQKTQPQTPKQPQPMKTLTNATASTRQLSAKERAILAFKGEKF